MPAPDLQTLLNYGANFRHAAVAVARANGIENIWTEMDKGNKTTPRLEVFFTLGEATGHKTPLPGLTQKETPHDAFRATLTWTTISNRETNGEAHDLLCAAARTIMLRFRHTFTDGVLPWYEINGAVPQRNAEMVDRENRLDHTQMPYLIHFNVRADAWPSFLPS